MNVDHSYIADPISSQPVTDVGIFICSSDGRLDVLQRVLPSLLKFWPDRPYPTYVGLNSQLAVSSEVTTVVAERSDWRKETLDQISQLTESHLIVVLDDFLVLSDVSQRQISALVAAAIQADLQYLRFLPVRQSIFERLRNQQPNTAEIRPIREKRPYYSGLQIALWNKAHLISLLKGIGTIWEFEHQSHKDVTHYAITGPEPIRYNHLVEKGRWLPYARALLRRAGLPTELGSRPVLPVWMHMRLVVDELRFHILGYANH